MNILKPSAYYEPEEVASTHLNRDLEEAISQNGHHLYIVTPQPTRGCTREQHKKYIKYERKGNISIKRFPMFSENKNVIMRTVRYILINIIEFFVCIRVKNADIIYAVSTPPTQGLLGALIANVKKKPYIYNLQDVFPDSMVNAQMIKKGGVIWKIGRIIENYTYKNANKIIVISEDIKVNLKSKGVEESKIVVIPNWVNAKKVYPIDRGKNYLFDELSLNREKFYIVYAGNIGMAQNIKIIINAAKKLEKYCEIEFLIFGEGVKKNQILEYAKAKKTKNIRFFPLRSLNETAYVYSLGNASIITCKKGFGGSAMPSKIWSIMATRTAILASFDKGTVLQEFIQKNVVGLFSEAENEEEFISNILKLYKDKELEKELGDKGRLYIEQYNNSCLATKRYIKEMEQLIV